MNQTVHDTTESAKDKAREAASTAQDQAKGQVDTRTTQAGEQLQDKADNLHAVGDTMRERGDDTFAQVADKVAGWTEDLSRYLRDADADRMLGDVEAYARRQPWAVAAGGALLGFAASRVVRAGSDRRHQSQLSGTSRYAGYGSTDRDIDLTRTGTPTPTPGYAAGTTGGYSTPAGTGAYAGTGTGTYSGTEAGTYAGGSGYEPLADDALPGTAGVPDTDRAPLGDRGTTGGFGSGTHVDR